jgi:hypothetical protein
VNNSPEFRAWRKIQLGSALIAIAAIVVGLFLHWL